MRRSTRLAAPEGGAADAQQRADAPARLLELADGRTLAYQVYGAPSGPAVYFLHGFPGSHVQAALAADQAAAAGVRLVAMDRPGFGGSTPDPLRTIAGFADDVRQLADRLDDARIGVVGISCGGAYALACAHRLPRLVCHVGLLAGMGPMDAPGVTAGQLPLLTSMFALARRSPVLVSPLLALDRLLLGGDPDRAVRALSRLLTPPDRALLAADPAVREIFGASLAAAYRQGIAGAMREAHLIGSERGFALEAIAVPVDVYQGGSDRHVPPAMGRHIAAHVPGAALHFCPDEGHLSIVVNRFADCLARFLALYRGGAGA